jgi:hypothetical protein
MSETRAISPDESLPDSPFIIEKLKKPARPVVEAVPVGGSKRNKLLIGGKVQEQYSGVRLNQYPFQRNNPNIVKFAATTGEEYGREGWGQRFIDIRNGKELATIVLTEDERSILVNGQRWSSITENSSHVGQSYSSEEYDPEGGKMVLTKNPDRGMHSATQVIVNDSVWNTQLRYIEFATSRFGTVYAIGMDSRQSGNIARRRLFINDKQWELPKNPSGRDIPEGRDPETYSVSDAVISKDGTVAAAVDVHVEYGKWRTYLFTGDKTQANGKWKNTLSKEQGLIIDDETGDIAMYGNSKKDSDLITLLINDIPHQLPDDVKKLDHFEFQNGGVIVEYTDALGKKTTEKITLRADAEEVQAQLRERARREEEKAALEAFLADNKLSLEDVQGLIRDKEELIRQRRENERLSDQAGRLTAESTQLQATIGEMRRNQTTASQSVETRAQAAETSLSKIEKVLNGLKPGTLTRNLRLSPDALDTLKLEVATVKVKLR